MTIKSRTDAITALSQLANVVKWLDGTLSQRLHVTSGGRTYRTITIEFEGDDPFTQIDSAHHAS